MMENNTNNSGYYETRPTPGQEAPKREYTLRQRLLLIVALALGTVFSWVVFADGFDAVSLSKGGLRYSAFWFAYLVGFYAITWGRSSKKPVGWALAGFAIWLMARYAVYEEMSLSLLNFIAIPLVLMLHAVECTADVPDSRQGGYITAYITGWFAAPFICMGRFFGAIGSLMVKKDSDPRSRAIRTGILAGLGLALIIVPLLLAADTAISGLLSGAFKDIELGPTVLRVIGALAIAMLFYSFIFRMAYEQPTYKAEPYNKHINSAGMAAAVGMLLGICAIFAAFQFTYLTGLAGLPEGLTYSEYATQGFSELCVVAAINLILFAVCVTFTPDGKLLRGMLTALLAATVMLLASAMARLIMYIDAYGLTINRILPFWFMVCLFIMIALCAAKLYMPRLKLLRLAAGAFAACYLALSVLNLDAMIARSVLARADERGGITHEDADYLRYTLSVDAKPVLIASEYKYDIYYDVEPEHLGN